MPLALAYLRVIFVSLPAGMLLVLMMAALRGAGDAPYRTDQGNLVLDCRFGVIANPAALAAALSAIPGALGHGLFLGEIDALYVAQDGRVSRIERGAA